MSDLQRFEFFRGDVRIGGTPEEPLFAFTDVCRELGIAKTRDAYARLHEDEKGGPLPVDTPGGTQHLTTVTEPGLYRLIFRSNKAEAERFRRRVFHEVLPQIRRTGEFKVRDENMVVVRRSAWDEHQRTIEALSEAYELQAAAGSKLASLAASMLAERRHSKPKDDPRQGLIRFEGEPDLPAAPEGQGGEA